MQQVLRCLVTRDFHLDEYIEHVQVRIVQLIVAFVAGQYTTIQF